MNILDQSALPGHTIARLLESHIARLKHHAGLLEDEPKAATASYAYGVMNNMVLYSYMLCILRAEKYAKTRLDISRLSQFTDHSATGTNYLRLLLMLISPDE
jgi:hypothetical protein